ncbi:hypothetical protein BGP84_10445 [Pseudomonas putida]|uniref:Uncharacterized protein n=1 Tax=Pseudomonas putida TaxID=303 RepID=A0A2S3X3W6_PSEPU|nr:hypothetical protein [Pseudomonas putida]POG10129.1 hypothetical protein BGP84_10445 [Pseudomonas putida]POG16272.1 hypothetical protein BGP85_08935 [Pseudomonas putida]
MIFAPCQPCYPRRHSPQRAEHAKTEEARPHHRRQLSNGIDDQYFRQLGEARDTAHARELVADLIDFDEKTARVLDALIEGFTIHNALSKTTVSRADILALIEAIA